MNTLLISLRLHLRDPQIITAALILGWLARLRSAALRRGQMRQGQDRLWSKCRTTQLRSQHQQLPCLALSAPQVAILKLRVARKSRRLGRIKAGGGEGTYCIKREVSDRRWNHKTKKREGFLSAYCYSLILTAPALLVVLNSAVVLWQVLYPLSL